MSRGVSKYGDVTPRLLRRFWSKVDVSAGPDGCWPWTASKRGEYGQFGIWVDGRLVVAIASRVSLWIATGQCGEVALHSCDNPPCVNPAHLSWGTHADNVRDKVEKGRLATGEAAGSKVSDEEVAELLRLVAAGMTNRQAARRFGISTTLVSYIRNGRTRADIDGPRSAGKKGRPLGWKVAA